MNRCKHLLVSEFWLLVIDSFNGKPKATAFRKHRRLRLDVKQARARSCKFLSHYGDTDDSPMVNLATVDALTTGETPILRKIADDF